MIDFLGKEINIGDKVVYLAGRQTGSSTRRNMLFKGQVIAFTPKMVRIKNEKCEELIAPWYVIKVEG